MPAARSLGSMRHEADAARAQRIGEHAAGDAARRRALERRDDAARDRVVGDDVEEQVDVRTRGVDVGDEPVEDAVVVGQHLDGVAAEDRHFAQLLGEVDAGRDRRVLRGVEHVGVARAAARGSGARARRNAAARFRRHAGSRRRPNTR